ncbi:MAG: phosphate-binding protein, partial [Candidatus Fonsibacter ubiquis]
MIKNKIIILSAFVMMITSYANARDQIKIVGSSTVYPYTTVVAERFGKQGKFKTP